MEGEVNAGLLAALVDTSGDLGQPTNRLSIWRRGIDAMTAPAKIIREDVEAAYQLGLLLPLTQALVRLSHTHPISPMRVLVLDDVAKALDAIDAALRAEGDVNARTGK